jgi:hypothetical protein
MTREARYRKKRYRTDPAWRAKHLAECKAHYDANKKHPVFAELVLTRSYIYHKREALARREAEVARMYDALRTLIAKRDRLATEWRNVSKSRRKVA